MVRGSSDSEYGVDIAVLFACSGGQVLSAMAGLEHHWYCWELRLRQNFSGYGDREVAESALGGDSGHGMQSRCRVFR
jgi:hypothetical protein